MGRAADLLMGAPGMRNDDGECIGDMYVVLSDSLFP